MIQNFTFKNLLLVTACLGFGQLFGQIATFSYTGAVQTYTVPGGVTSIQIETWGAQGGGSEICGGAIDDDGGLGGYAVGNLSVTPGDLLNIYVGGKPVTNISSSSPGGFNGGGVSGQYGGGGGGASDVRVGGITLTDRIIVAGGGGGGNTGCPNHGTGGVGGGYTGGDGISLSGYAIATGGTAVAGGIGAGGGTNGSFGIGGTGAYHVAGGGGGWYGGGAAYAAGSGGGSSYTDGVTDGSTTPGLRSGHGQIIITVLCSPLTVTVSETSICLGESFILDGSGVGTISWDGGVVNGEEFFPALVGITTYTATSDSDTDCGFSVDVEVLPLPNVNALVDATEICDGESVIFNHTGDADSYSWDPADVESGVAYAPAVGTSSYTVTGMDDVTGCYNSSTIDVTVYALPEVVATVSDDEICLTDEVFFTGEGAESYTWSPMGVMDGIAYEPLATGTVTYTVIGVDANGCENSATVDVTVYDELVITYTTTDELFGADGSIDITVTGGNPIYTFDWDNDGTGDFDDTEDLSGLTAGSYAVVLHDEAGCYATELIVVDSQLGLNSNGNHAIAIYPNPTTNFVTISYPGNFVYEVLSVEGKLLVTGSATNSSLVNFETFSTGTYLVRLTANDTQELVKVVKN